MAIKKTDKKPDLVFSSTSDLKLFAFMFRERNSVAPDTIEHLELSYGKKEEVVASSLISKYGRELDDMDMKLVGEIPADMFVTPIIEDLFYKQWEEKQKEFVDLQNATNDLRKKKFITNLKMANDRWGAKLGDYEHKNLIRIINKLEKVS